MRVGLVRNAAFGMVALVGLGLAGCDDNPTDFDTGETVKITVNPTTMHVAAGNTALLESRTENAGNEPTWENIEASVDASCGSGAITLAVPDDFIPDLQPPGVFEVTGGNTLGTTCVELSGGGENATVDVSVVADSIDILNAPETLALFETVDLNAALLSGDGSGVSPFDQVADVTWTTDDATGEIMTVDEDGVVTAEGAVGAVAITATWSDLGATVNSTVAIATNQPELEIENAPTDSLLIDTSVDLDVSMVNPDDPPFDFGPFDQNTDVTWSSSDDDIVSVDESTGEATATGFGTATITVTWNEADDVTGSVDIPVTIPAPDLTTATPASGNLGDEITLTGTGFHPAMSVFVDEDEILAIYEPTIVNATTATFHLPFGSDGDMDVQVGAPGELSDPVTVTRAISEPTEPDNDDPGTAPMIVLPVDMWGVVQDGDVDDMFKFTLAAETTFDIFLDWQGTADLDLLITDDPQTQFVCFAASVDHPEEGECTLPAGDYILWINSYDAAFGAYRVITGP